MSIKNRIKRLRVPVDPYKIRVLWEDGGRLVDTQTGEVVYDSIDEADVIRVTWGDGR